MSFVKDDHKHTRGVGAVASMDAVSPARRRAAARGAVALARRDAVMARHTLGRAPLFTSPATSTYGARSIEVDPFGRGAGGLKPKPPGGGGGGGGKTPPPKPGDRSAFFDHRITKGKRGLTVKGPGSVIGQPSLEPVKGEGLSPPPLPPAKGSTTIVAGGSAPWISSASRSAPSPDMPPPQLPDLPDEPSGPVATAPTKKPAGSLLMYALIGVGAYWLLTRK